GRRLARPRPRGQQDARARRHSCRSRRRRTRPLRRDPRRPAGDRDRSRGRRRARRPRGLRRRRARRARLELLPRTGPRAAVAAAVVATSPAASSVGFLQARQLDSGGFAEAGRPAYPQLTAWAVLGLRAAGATPGVAAARYLAQREPDLTSATDLALVVLAED